MLGAPVIGIGLMMVNYLGVENHPELASAYLIAANVINLVLDYIFLRYTPLGITGASLSTVLGFLFAMGIFVLYIRSDKRNLHLILLKPGELGITKEAIITGVPMLIFMAANFVKALGLNTIIMNQLGEEGMAVFTVCDNVLLIVEMLTGGIIGVIPNVAGILLERRTTWESGFSVKDAEIQLHPAGCDLCPYYAVYRGNHCHVRKRRWRAGQPYGPGAAHLCFVCGTLSVE